MIFESTYFKRDPKFWQKVGEGGVPKKLDIEQMIWNEDLGCLVPQQVPLPKCVSAQIIAKFII